MAAARREKEMGMALTFASQDNKIIEICRLLTQGADVNYVHRWMNEGEERSTTPLIQAALNGHAVAMRVLISRGAEVNKHEPCNGNTALHAATEGGNREAAICLLDHGADINAQDKQGFTPLSQAAQESHLTLVDLLILRGADLNLANNQGATPLGMAAQRGHLEIVQFLGEKGAVVDQPANDSCTALGLASRQGHLEVVDFLLSAGAKVNHLSAKDMTPLHAAAQEGHLNVVKLLVNKGADIQQVSTGLNPLLHAALCGQSEVVDYLMSKGATFEAVGTIDKVCKCCGAGNATMKCALCLTVYYCSPECQKKDWKEGGQNRHKIQCAALVEARARYMEKAKREIEEKIAQFVMCYEAGNGGEAGPSSPRG